MGRRCEVRTGAKNDRRSKVSYEITCTLCTDIIYSIYNVECEQYIHLEFRVIFPREDRANKSTKSNRGGKWTKGTSVGWWYDMRAIAEKSAEC